MEVYGAKHKIYFLIDITSKYLKNKFNDRISR